MQRVHTLRTPVAVLATVLALAVASTMSVRFAASEPGADLSPLGDAAKVIHLMQAQETVLWVSLTGPVTQVTTWGWPVSDGEVELGGGMAITRPDGGESGTIDIGEKPMAVSFETGS
ncbi:MAG: hypothetical protein DWQ40_12620 [Actinobacteria bacterium]|nr:MAG: hypothetical protein DWQ40_12620 [Actinomycetota bacterium]